MDPRVEFFIYNKFLLSPLTQSLKYLNEIPNNVLTRLSEYKQKVSYNELNAYNGACRSMSVHSKFCLLIYGKTDPVKRVISMNTELPLSAIGASSRYDKKNILCMGRKVGNGLFIN